MRILGREPAAIVAVAGSFLTVLVALTLPWLNTGQAAAIMGVLSAVVIALTTRPIAPALVTGAFTALVALFAQYGLNISDSLVAAISGAILALFAFISREQVAPRDTAVTRS